MAERCLSSFSSIIPALPALYNNYKRIVQAGDRVMLLNEMVHDVRVIRVGGEHPPADIKFWMGDSIGRWEGDTLVVETTNFLHEPGGFGFGSIDNLKITERFTRWDEDTLHYAFEVENPDRWTTSWKGDFTWPEVDGRVYEYACHEGNYALRGILRGARVLEQDARDAKDTSNDYAGLFELTRNGSTGRSPVEPSLPTSTRLRLSGRRRRSRRAERARPGAIRHGRHPWRAPSSAGCRP
jgi:hypothetical protein